MSIYKTLATAVIAFTCSATACFAQFENCNPPNVEDTFDGGKITTAKTFQVLGMATGSCCPTASNFTINTQSIKYTDTEQKTQSKSVNDTLQALFKRLTWYLTLQQGSQVKSKGDNLVLTSATERTIPSSALTAKPKERVMAYCFEVTVDGSESQSAGGKNGSKFETKRSMMGPFAASWMSNQKWNCRTFQTEAVADECAPNE